MVPPSESLRTTHIKTTVHCRQEYRDYISRHCTLSNSVMCSDSYPIPILSLFFLYHPYIPYFLIQRIFHFLLYFVILFLARCSDGQLRLIGGSEEQYGRLEMCSNQRWGTFSSSSWSTDNSFVACTELGYQCKYYYLFTMTCKQEPHDPVVQQCINPAVIL